MAVTKEDPYIREIVQEKVQAQWEIHSQAVKIATLKAHIDSCRQYLIPSFRQQPHLLLHMLEEVIKHESQDIFKDLMRDNKLAGDCAANLDRIFRLSRDTHSHCIFFMINLLSNQEGEN